MYRVIFRLLATSGIQPKPWPKENICLKADLFINIFYIFSNITIIGFEPMYPFLDGRLATCCLHPLSQLSAFLVRPGGIQPPTKT